MKKLCRVCGKEFETSSNRTVCYNTHYRQCEICGDTFELKWPYTQKTCDKAVCRAAHTRNVSNSKEHICELCGKPFYPRSPRQKYCDGPHLKKCVICGKEFEYTKDTVDKKTCGSKSCIQVLRERTCSEKFGTTNAMQSDVVQAKVKEQNQAKYGVNWTLDRPDVQKKIRQSMKARYGKQFSSQISSCQDRFKSTMQSRYDGEYTMCSPVLRNKAVNTMLKRYGVPYYCMTEDYHRFQRHLIYNINRDFQRRLESIGVESTLEKRIEDRQYDVCIESSRILIEIDPTITHNSVFSIFDKNSSGLDKFYHRDKSELALKHGYRCIHVFDWDDADKILDILRPKKFLYARNLAVKEVSITECEEFLNEYHLQSSCRGQDIRIGLYRDNERIQVMTFGRPRYNNKYEYELLRLCTKCGYGVVGGASRLFQYFIRNYSPASIISYCDAAKFKGTVYKQMGMKLVRTVEPSKVWSKNNRKVTDNLLRARGYDQLFKTNYGKGSSNEQLMLDNGWLPVYDCGQFVFTWCAQN